MKKVLCIALALAMVLGLAACGGNKDKDNKKTEFKSGVLYAGFGREDITPTEPTPLGGYGNSAYRLHTAVRDNIYATCIALTEGENTMLFITVDSNRCDEAAANSIREGIQKETGVPVANIMVVSTHSHACPDQSFTDSEVIAKYLEMYVSQTIKAAKTALDDRSEATLYTGTVDTEGMSFVRHYLMKDGTYAGDNFGSWTTGIQDYACENDPQMVLAKLDRGEDKQPIVMMNFQAHPSWTGGANKYELSADYIGVCRQVMEEKTDALFAFYLGDCGNQNAETKIPADRIYEDVTSYGTALAQYAIDLMPSLTKSEDNTIKTTSKEIVGACNKSDPARLADAKEVYAVYSSTGDRDTANVLAESKGFASVYECSGIINRASLPDTDTMTLYATRIGDLNIVNAPYEMFTANGLYIKENSVGATTMVMTQSNAANGYVPSEDAFAYNCYESFSSRFGKGVAEQCAETLVELIREVQ